MSLLGMNIGGEEDWDPDAPWVNAARILRFPWGIKDQPWNPDASIQYDANGYPTTPAGSVSDTFRGYPDGIYKCTWTGSCQVTWGGIAVSTPTGPNSCDVNIQHGRNGQTLLTVAVVPQGSWGNLRLICPGYDVNTTQVFRNEYLADLKGFKCIRFMDPFLTVNSVVTDWAQRRNPNSLQRTSSGYMPGSGFGGWAYEDMVSLCNTLMIDPWVNIPYKATDDFVTKLMQFLKANLNPALKPYVEYSNENWNSAQVQEYTDLVAMGKAIPSLADANTINDFGWVVNFTAYRASQVAQIVKQQFPTARPVLGAWAANTWFCDTMLTWIKTHVAEPATLFYGFAIAPYFADEWTSRTVVESAGLTADTFFSYCTTEIANDVTGWINGHAALATKYGIKMLGYEGGYGNGTKTNEDVKAAVQTDPRMGTLIQSLCNAWKAANGDVINLYKYQSTGLPADHWEHRASAPKWQAVQAIKTSWNGPTPPPPPPPPPAKRSITKVVTYFSDGSSQTITP